ncbi:MAG: c-type cytochrome [Chloroflexi bacterium]|nr:c-type cytochrome [Chloroflexota bacterium]
MPNYYRQYGQVLQLGEKLETGVDGDIFQIPTLPNLVAKIYHELDAKRTTQLRAMVNNPPFDLTLAQNWPKELILNSEGACVGFLTPYSNPSTTAPRPVEVANTRLGIPLQDVAPPFRPANQKKQRNKNISIGIALVLVLFFGWWMLVRGGSYGGRIYSLPPTSTRTSLYSITPNPASDTDKGLVLFQANGCVICHVNNGRTAGIGPKLQGTTRDDTYIRNQIANGLNAMPAFPHISEEQKTYLIAYIRSLSPNNPTTASSGDPAKGLTLFRANGCIACHLNEGRTAGIGLKLQGTTRDDTYIRNQIKTGRNAMPPFPQITEDQKTDIIAYIRSL